jgi:hypothetical protein
MTTKSSLSPARQRLVEMMQETNFGSFERLEVRGGEPVLEPPPKIRRRVAFGRMNAPNPARAKDDFVLKQPVRELFALFDEERELVIEDLVLQHGLPVRMTVTDVEKEALAR